MVQNAATKEELLSEIQRLTALLGEKDDQIAQQAAVARTDEGWMVSTPNPTYTGRTAGVYFEDGHAFIPYSAKDAEKTVKRLTVDFGYSASRTSGAVIEAPETKTKSKREVLEQIAKPTLMGAR